jgi:hypothetical protein
VVSLEKLWALQIVDEAGDLLALTVTNEKGIQKSIENQDLWTLHPETDRLIPWQEGVSLVSLMAHKDGYQAVVRGGEARLPKKHQQRELLWFKANRPWKNFKRSSL